MVLPVKLIAFYLPQFHPIPENDRFWGRGFTEWSNVSKAQPVYEGHYQPHLPSDLGFYDLRLPETRQAQADLAAEYGVYGFCYHYYWFGGKKLLQTPIEAMLKSKQPNYPFCICWANENWTRKWDGADKELLIAQNHSPEDDVAFIRELIPYFLDPRYIRVGGKPLLVVYRVGSLPTPQDTTDRWREECEKQGVGGLYLVAAQTFGLTDPRPLGFDAAVEFPPHKVKNKEIPDSVNFIGSDFKGLVYDYEETVKYSIIRPPTDYTLFRTVMPGWDNTARLQNKGYIFHGSTPEGYEFWLRELIARTIEQNKGDERLVFVNAWNEWGEGCHLEPDRKFGHSYLQATYNALCGVDGWQVLLRRLDASLPNTSAANEELVRGIRQLFESRDRTLRAAIKQVAGLEGIEERLLKERQGLEYQLEEYKRTLTKVNQSWGWRLLRRLSGFGGVKGE